MQSFEPQQHSLFYQAYLDNSATVVLRPDTSVCFAVSSSTVAWKRRSRVDLPEEKSVAVLKTDKEPQVK
jgi:hypothetical protein